VPTDDDYVREGALRGVVEELVKTRPHDPLQFLLDLFRK
jgi:hypothetical protein